MIYSTKFALILLALQIHDFRVSFSVDLPTSGNKPPTTGVWFYGRIAASCDATLTIATYNKGELYYAK